MKKIDSIFVIILISIIPIACSTTKKDVMYSNVQIEDGALNKVIPIISKSEAGPYIGPTRTDNEFEKLKTNKERPTKIVGIFLAPSLYGSMSYIKLLQGFERVNQKLHFIGGHGFGALIASYYSLGHKADHIEWKLHKLLIKLKGERPFGNEWKMKIDGFLKKEFQKTQMEFGDTSLIIPIWNKGEIIYKKRGSLLDALRSSFGLGEEAFGKNFHHKVFNINTVKEMGVDYSIYAMALNSKMSWHYPADYLLGIYGRVLGKFKNEAQDFDQVIHFNLDSLAIDNVEIINEIIKSSQLTVKDYIQSFEQNFKE